MPKSPRLLLAESVADFLRKVREKMGVADRMLVGIDLRKDGRILERAYDDSQGVTADFNLNMLRHLNREYGFDFDLESWSHDARYNESEGRIEIRLISSTLQTVNIGQETIEVDAGEGIVTEYSHKYTLAGFAAMAEKAGFEIARVWIDPNNLFSVQYCTRS